MLKGIAVSNGVGIGRVLLIEEKSLKYIPKTVTDTDTEISRLQCAIAKFCRKTEKQAEALKKTTGESEAEIITGHIGIAKDPFLAEETEKLIKNGQCAESALESVCDIFISVFSASDDDLTKQRAADVRDVKKSILRLLLGIEEVKISEAPKGTILVAKELTPSMTAEIVKENIVGIVTETGSTTSHSAIIARALEIPAVLSVPNAVDILKNGSTAIVDGSEGIVINTPDAAMLESFSLKRETLFKERKELETFRGKKTVSASGEKYELFCNIGNPDDALAAMEYDSEGVGLFRTEFLFMNRTSFPTEKEQFEAYKRAALILKGKPLTIRTLDIGGDKPLPYLGLQKEENPFLGFRAIRYCLKNENIFKTQLRAILRASAFGNIKIMFPLITCIDELREGKAQVESVKKELRAEHITFDENIEIGVMIETAAAAVIADILAKEADFFSIGTNDLIGYTMACDRGNSSVSYLYSVFQPSVLRMIKRTIECGQKNHIPVGMCGEAAANPLMIPLLISFGLTEFSVSAPSVLSVRKSISKFTKQQAEEITQNVMNLTSEKEIDEYLKTVI